MNENEEFVEYNVDLLARATVHAKDEADAKRKAERGLYEILELVEAKDVEKSQAQVLYEQENKNKKEEEETIK